MRHAFTIAGTEHALWLERAGAGYRLHGLGRVVPVALEALGEGNAVLTLAGARQDVMVAADGDHVYIHLDGETWTVHYADPIERYSHAHGASADDVAEAPMPGVVIAVLVKDGETVVRGDTLVVIESMKLETAVKAPRDGTIASVHVAVGQSFDRTAPLVTLAAEAGA